MPANKLTHVPCPSCDGSGRFWHHPVLTPPMVGLTMGSYISCRYCSGQGEVPNELKSFPIMRNSEISLFKAPVALDDRLQRLAQEVAQLEEMCNHGVITTEEFGDAIRDLLRT